MINIIKGSKRKTKNREYKVYARCMECKKIFSIHLKYVPKATGKCGSCRTTTHGKCGTRAYKAWAEMKKRCDNPTQMHYHRYGGRGISYDPKWSSFEGFLEDMGEPPNPKDTIDRINNDGNYTKDNCRWISHKENCRNTRNVVLITYNGKTQCISAWREELGVSKSLFNSRRRSLGNEGAIGSLL